jgi:hypothetical protein
MSGITAVLTGDLVASTRSQPELVEQTMTALAEQSALIGDEVDHDLRFTRFRGDGWQMHLADPGDFLWITVYLNAVLRSEPKRYLPSRVAIGLGSTDRLGQTGLSAASGTAFINSGRALDAMFNRQTIALSGEGTDDIQRSAIAFVDVRISDWSREQAEVLALRLRPGSDPTQEEMAAVLGISRQAVNARLKSANWGLFHTAMDAFRNHDWEPDHA